MSVTTPRTYHGSSTITIAPSPPPVSVHVVERPTIQSRVEELVQQMKESGLFSQQVDVWEHTCLHRFSDVGTPSTRLSASQALAFLLFEVVRSARCDVSWEAALKAILDDTLPPEVSMQGFLSLYEQPFRQEAVCRQKLDYLRTWVQEEQRKIYASANSVNEEIVEAFNGVKRRIQALIEQRNAGLAPIRRELDEVAARVEQLQRDLLAHSKQAEALIPRLEALHVSDQQIAHYGISTLRRI